MTATYANTTTRLNTTKQMPTVKEAFHMVVFTSIDIIKTRLNTCKPNHLSYLKLSMLAKSFLNGLKEIK
jgi:hypothetical protein